VQKLLKQTTKLLVYLLPFALIAGIFDYRFRNYFWGSLNQYRPFQTGYMFDFFSIFTLFLIVFFIFALISYLMARKRKKLNTKNSFPWLSIPIALIGIGIVFQILFYTPLDPVIKSLPYELFIHFILPILLFISIINLYKKGIFDKDILEKSFILAFSLLGLFSIFEYFTNVLPGANQNFMGRLVWPYIDPFVDMNPESANHLAFLFGPVAILSLIRIKSPNFKKYWLEISGTIISFVLLLLTQSYAGILAVAAVITTYLLIKASKKWRKLIVIGLIAVMGIGIATQYKTDKFQALLGNYHKVNSVNRRAQIYDFTTQAFLLNPVPGIGPANYQNYFRANMQEFIRSDVPEEEIPPHTHNLLGHFWTELGIFGLAGMLFIYVFIVGKIVYKPKYHIYYLLPLYPLLHGLLDTPYSLQETSTLFWILIALALISEKDIGQRMTISKK